MSYKCQFPLHIIQSMIHCIKINFSKIHTSHASALVFNITIFWVHKSGINSAIYWHKAELSGTGVYAVFMCVHMNVSSVHIFQNWQFNMCKSSRGDDGVKIKMCSCAAKNKNAVWQTDLCGIAAFRSSHSLPTIILHQKQKIPLIMPCTEVFVMHSRKM